MLARVMDVSEVLLLALVDLAEHLLQENLGEPEYRIERRARFVGHVRQELGLVSTGHLEFPHFGSRVHGTAAR